MCEWRERLAAAPKEVETRDTGGRRGGGRRLRRDCSDTNHQCGRSHNNCSSMNDEWNCQMPRGKEVIKKFSTFGTSMLPYH